MVRECACVKHFVAARPNGRFGLCIREVDKGEHFSEISRYFICQNSEIIVICKLKLFIEELTTMLRCFGPIQHLTGHELTRPRTCERGEGRGEEKGEYRTSTCRAYYECGAYCYAAPVRVRSFPLIFSPWVAMAIGELGVQGGP